MATLLAKKLRLIPGGWGAPSRVSWVPPDGFTGGQHFNVSVPQYQVGTVVQVYNSGTTAGVPGNAQLAYLRLDASSGNVTAGALLIETASGTLTSAVNGGYTTTLSAISRIAIAIGAVTAGNYAWFWVGGVCPAEIVSGLGNAGVVSATLTGGMRLAVGSASGALTLVEAAVDFSGETATLCSVADALGATESE